MEGHQNRTWSQKFASRDSYVTDISLLEDEKLDFDKCVYIAIGVSEETEGGCPIKKQDGILAGTIGKFFGTGNQN